MTPYQGLDHFGLAVKAGAPSNDFLERLAGDAEWTIALEEMQAVLDPRRFVGRAPEQVDDFLDEVVEPLLAGASADAPALEEVRV